MTTHEAAASCSVLLRYASSEHPDAQERVDAAVTALRSKEAPRLLALWDGNPKAGSSCEDALMSTTVCTALESRKPTVPVSLTGTHCSCPWPWFACLPGELDVLSGHGGFVGGVPALA